MPWQQIITQALVWAMDGYEAFLANQDLWHNLGSDRGTEKKEGRTEEEAFLASTHRLSRLMEGMRRIFFG